MKKIVAMGLRTGIHDATEVIAGRTNPRRSLAVSMTMSAEASGAPSTQRGVSA